MITSLKRVFHRGTRTNEFCECRDCGSTVVHPASGCPTCDSTEIACYEL